MPDVNNWMSDLAAFASALAAVGATRFAGWQVRQFVRHNKERDRLEREGVSLMWEATKAPYKPEPDGTAVWQFKFTFKPWEHADRSGSLRSDVRRRPGRPRGSGTELASAEPTLRYQG
jgi:hypothetical protein